MKTEKILQTLVPRTRSTSPLPYMIKERPQPKNTQVTSPS